MHIDRRVWALATILLLTTSIATVADEPERKQFTFSWPYAEGDSMSPRGGTSRGTRVELATEPTEAWRALQAPGLSAFERDRRAILAMAGPYRASFDFIETVQLDPEAAPRRPYRSWGTEYVFVAEDSGELITLQHVLVMFVQQNDGTVAGPFVQKHWRQDWRYEDRDMHVYVGDDTWQHERLSTREADGAWTQAVFQVDDGPRYEASGRWEHTGGYSAWTSGRTWRPLPRREYSVRSDYDVLDGTNRHTIVPTGWVHEQDNLKVVLDGHERATGQPYVARELGLNRYERTTGFDFSAGREYWERTGAFWGEVRTAWEEVYAEHGRFRLADERGGRTLYERLFEQAEQGDGAPVPEGMRELIGATLAEYVIVE